MFIRIIRCAVGGDHRRRVRRLGSARVARPALGAPHLRNLEKPHTLAYSSSVANARHPEQFPSGRKVKKWRTPATVINCRVRQDAAAVSVN